MKYTQEITQQLVELYNNNTSVKEIAEQFDVPERSVIAKLSSLGVYRRKEYRNKRGEVPVKKEELIEKIAELLHCDLDLLESLEKCNKNVLQMIELALTENKKS